MKFKYTALNPDNRQTSGVLEASDLEVAKQELHQMNLSILVINKISDEEYVQKNTEEQAVKVRSGILTYSFKAKDPYQKVIEGTIDAKDIYSAFKRLISHYHFQVLALHPQEQSDLADAILQTNFEADFKLWQQQLKAEGIDLEKELRATPLNKDLEGENEVLNRKIVEEIDQFIIKAKGVLKSHSDQFSLSFLEAIKNKLANLERIRSSNNIENITKVSNELYELLSHPDRFSSTSEEKQGAYRETLSTIGKNELIQKQAEATANQFSAMKGGFDQVLGKLQGVKSALPTMDTSSVTDWRFLVKSFWLYLKAPRGPLKTARYEAFKNAREKRRSKVSEEKRQRWKKFSEFWNASINRDYTLFFTELNSFVGWLLAFYVTYLFASGLSLEKGVGLPESFVLKTLRDPLILNVTFFLLWTHLVLKVKLNLFHKQFLASLLFFGFAGIFYGMVVVNF